MTRRILLSITILIIVVCVGVSLILIPGAFLLAGRGPGMAPDAAQPTPTRTLVVMPTSTPGSNLPTDVEQQMDQIQTEVMQIRGLTLQGTADPGCLDGRTTARSSDERVL
jgi:hypothetical protein